MGVLLLIPALALYRELSEDPDIWWTPPGLALSLTDSQDRVQIYVRGKPLPALLTSGQLRVVDESGASAVGPAEISLRFNNLDRVRLGRLPVLLTYAAAIGAGFVLLILIATGRLAYRTAMLPVAT